MPASNQQVQQFVNDRIRIHCEQIRALKLAIEDDAAAINDVYQNLANNPTWTDDPTNSTPPPHLLTASDVLAYNTFIVALSEFFKANGDPNTMASGGDQWPVIESACIRPVTVV